MPLLVTDAMPLHPYLSRAWFFYVIGCCETRFCVAGVDLFAGLEIYGSQAVQAQH